MDTSLAAINRAILENLQNAGDDGLHTDDLVRILGFEAKGQILPRLYKLQGENQIQRLDGNRWKIMSSDFTPPELATCTVQMDNAWCHGKIISYRNILQEYCQKKLLPVPSYTKEKTSDGIIGTVSFGSDVTTSQVAMPSIKEAYQRVAFEALKDIHVLPDTAQFNEPCPVQLPSKKRKSESPNSSDSSNKIKLMDTGSCPSMKSKLQEIAQKKKLKMPEYIISGTAKNYMASVTFDGQTFSSKSAFAKKKLAEQHVAHIALYELGHIPSPPDGYVVGKTNGPKSGSKSSNENYKNSLQEYVQSKKCKLPNYRTVSQVVDGKSGFVSTVIVEGREYRGSFNKIKKEAEKQAAFVALQTIGIATE